MNYPGPSRSDFANVRALNREFLRVVKASPEAFDFETQRRNRLVSLGRRQAEWLSAVPFLLLSVQEDDAALWQRLVRDDPYSDLFIGPHKQSADVCNLAATAVGFLWQLAQHNPYAVRLLSGAPPGWCELITGVTYFELVTLVRNCANLLVVRSSANTEFWTKLLDGGVRPENDIRRASQIAALQIHLTSRLPTLSQAWPAAACRTRQPQLRVAEKGDR